MIIFLRLLLLLFVWSTNDHVQATAHVSCSQHLNSQIRFFACFIAFRFLIWCLFGHAGISTKRTSKWETTSLWVFRQHVNASDRQSIAALHDLNWRTNQNPSWRKLLPSSLVTIQSASDPGIFHTFWIGCSIKSTQSLDYDDFRNLSEKWSGHFSLSWFES